MTRTHRHVTAPSAARRCVLLVASLAVLAAGGPTAAATPTPPAAREGVLATGTRIEWTGVKGFRLVVPRDAMLPEYGAHLVVHRGTYAVVRWRYAGSCAPSRCWVSGHLDYTRGMARVFDRGDPPGEDHMSRGAHDLLPRGTWDLYLMTDGAASLTFDVTGLPARPRTWTAAGRISARVVPLPATCSTTACKATTGYAGRIRSGGATWSLSRLGQADLVVARYDRSDLPVPQVHAVRACVYPRVAGPRASPAESDHPTGCDLDPTDVAATFNFGMTLVPAGGRVAADTNPLATGPVYLGFVVGSAQDVTEPVYEAYGVWLEFGIR
jgi:hypothetical protein